jgi:hypothetical protein
MACWVAWVWWAPCCTPQAKSLMLHIDVTAFLRASRWLAARPGCCYFLCACTTWS